MISIRKLVLSIIAIVAICASPVKSASTQISEMRYWFGSGQPVTIKARAGEPLHIPYTPDRRDLVCVFNYQVKDIDGKWSVPHQHYFMPPKNSFAPIPDNLELTLTSYRGNVVKKKSILKSQKKTDIDVKNLDPGIYNMTGTLINPVNGDLIGVTNSFVDIKPVGGNTLKEIYYWLNDSLTFMSKLDMGNASIPIGKSVDLSIDSNDIPSLDNKLTVNNGVAEIAPNYKISVAFRNSSGFVADSTAWLTDNSRRRKLLPLWLEPSKQYDIELAERDTCYWYAFTAQTGDVVDFSARRPCRVKIYDPLAVLLDTALFTDKSKLLRSNISTSGTHYIQVSEIDPSKQIFSTMATYISGPTLVEINKNKGNSGHTHEGVALSWEDAAEWKKNGEQIQLSKSNIDVSISKVEGFHEPYIAKKSNLCRVYPGNVVILKSKGYIEKAVLCVRNADGIVLPKITSPAGNVEIDSLTNCVIWSGISDRVELSLSQGQSDGDAMLPISRIFVKQSELSHNDVVFDDDDLTDKDDSPFNMIYIWKQGEVLASHNISESSKICFDNDNLTVYSDNQTYSYSLESKLILTFEYFDNPGLSNVDDIKIAVTDNNIIFNSLPAFVGIYSLNGYTYFADYVSDPDFTYPLDKLNSGIYIIKVGDKVSKIMIQ